MDGVTQDGLTVWLVENAGWREKVVLKSDATDAALAECDC
jgi:hypothetical protein